MKFLILLLLTAFITFYATSADIYVEDSIWIEESEFYDESEADFRLQKGGDNYGKALICPGEGHPCSIKWRADAEGEMMYLLGTKGRGRANIEFVN